MTSELSRSRWFEQVRNVYFDDLDPLHILHNSRYVVLFERTVGAFWADLGLGAFQDSGRPDQFHLVVHNSVDYLNPVRGVCRVRVRVGIEALGRSSLTFALALHAMDEQIVHARGRRVIVHVDPDRLVPTPWTEATRAALQPWVP